MTRAEFAEMVARLYEAGKITSAQAADMQHGVRIGDIAIGSMPLPWSQLPGELTPDELKDSLFHAAVRLTPQAGKKLLESGRRPKITNTPPEVSKFLRERLRNHLRGDYEGTMRGVAQRLHGGQDVRAWHETMVREQRAYIARQMTAGLGRALTETDMQEVNRLSRLQNGYLQGFASEVSARRILGNEWSLAYLSNRHLQYGGMGWGAWFRGNEIAEARGDGYVIVYIAQDDGNTCGPCHDAASNGPYLPGSAGVPYPGQICRGHGLCRCRHEVRFDMDSWRRLKGLSDTKRAEKTAPALEEQRRRVASKLAERDARRRRAADEAERKRKAEDDAIESARLEDEARIRRAMLEAVPAPYRLSMFAGFDADISIDDPTKVRRLLSDTRTFDELPRSERADWQAAQDLKRLVDERLRENMLEVKSVKAHGMTDAQEMEGILLDGVEIRWGAGQEGRVSDTIARWYIQDKLGKSLPKAVWEAQQTIVFTNQKNSEDPYWATVYGDPDFVTMATGGDGGITVYNQSRLSHAMLAHEAGHNIATRLYGTPDPTKPKTGSEVMRSEWQEAMALETRKVSDYALVHPQEDFAESVSYFTDANERMKETHPLRYALVEKILRGQGEDKVRTARAEAIATSEESAERARRLLAPRKGETEEERKARHKVRDERWKERKAREAEEAKKREVDAKATAKEDERLVAAAARAKYDVDRAAVEESSKTIIADEAGADARRAEIKRVSGQLTHLRWRAKRTSGDVLADVEGRIATLEAELKRLKETPDEETTRTKDEADELARLARLREEEERRESDRLAAEAARLAEEARIAREDAERAERARIAEVEAAKKAAAIEAERIRVLEEKKAKKRATHEAWKLKKAAEKAAALAVPKLMRHVPDIYAEIGVIDAEVTRIRDKRTRGEVDTVGEKAFMDTRRAELALLWAEGKASEIEDAELIAGPKPATGLPAKKFRPVRALESEITLIEVEAIRLDRRSRAGESLTSDERMFILDKTARIRTLTKERDDSADEDSARASGTPASPTTTAKKYRHVISLESEISTIDGETARLGRKSKRGETLTAAETDFLSKKDARLAALRKEHAASAAEDKVRISTGGHATAATTVVSGKTKTAKTIIVPTKALREVSIIRAEYDAYMLEDDRLTDKLRAGERLSPDEESWYSRRRRLGDELNEEIYKSQQEDNAIAALQKKADALARGTGAGPVDLKYRPDATEIAALVARTADDLTRQGVDPDDALAAFKDILDRHPAIINTKNDILSFWKVGEERFKTQFETGTSMGSNNNRLRARAEKAGLGYSSDPDVRRSERPVYGALRTDPNAGKHYGGPGGGFAWKVKDEVKARMTVTMGDSLGPFQSGSQMGTPMNDPGLEGIGATWGQGSFVRYAKSKRTQADLDDFMLSIAYIEWQCQGQLLLSDIEWVEDRGRNLSSGDIKWLEDRGVEVRR